MNKAAVSAVEKRPEIPRTVINKLIIFTAAMVIAPVATFFIAQKALNVNSILSGGIAALVANVVLVGYIIVAFTEDLSDNVSKDKKND